MGFFSRKENRSQDVPVVDNNGLGLSNLVNKAQIPSISLSAVFAAVEIISNSVAELPINVKTREDDKTGIVKVHPIYEALNNGITTKFMLLKMLITDMLLYGNGIAYIDRDADGTPLQIVYCPYGTYNINYNANTRQLYYTITSLRRGRIEPIDIIHLVKNSRNGVEGIGVLNYASHTLELAKATEKAAQDYFSSGCHVAGILSTTAQRLTKDQREAIRDAWNQAHGTKGTGMAILENGMQYSPVAANSKESQLLETRLFNLNDIARFFSISPVLLGDLSHSSYSTIEASLLEFVTHTLFPYITLIENEFTRKLIKPSEKNLFIDLDENYIVKSDKQSQANYLSTLVSKGIMTVNEARYQLGLNPMEGGDKLFVAFTDINQNTINNKNTEKEEDEQ
jgi:HK97 family phage portal protein